MNKNKWQFSSANVNIIRETVIWQLQPEITLTKKSFIFLELYQEVNKHWPSRYCLWIYVCACVCMCSIVGTSDAYILNRVGNDFVSSSRMHCLLFQINWNSHMDSLKMPTELQRHFSVYTFIPIYIRTYICMCAGSIVRYVHICKRENYTKMQFGSSTRKLFRIYCPAINTFKVCRFICFL